MENTARIQFNQSSNEDRLDRIKDHFYRGHNQSVQATIEEELNAAIDDRTYTEMLLLSASAFYEVGKIKESQNVLQSFGVFREIDCKASYNYVVGRLKYFDGLYDEANHYFQEVTHLTDDPVIVFRSLLGIGNIAYSKGNCSALAPLLSRMEIMKQAVNPEEQISLQFLFGNYYRLKDSDSVLARKYFELALGASSEKSWNYFSHRALYFLACLDQEEGRNRELAGLISLMNAMLVKSESLYLKDLVREKFKGALSKNNATIQLDVNNLRLKLGSKWIDLHQKPLLFEFIKLLSNRDAFLSKADVAASLWPRERYLPRTHDPRTFDMIRRIRTIVEENQGHSVVLLSGRHGFKLTTRDDETTDLEGKG